MGISQNALARAACVPPRRINEVVLGKRAITADTAVRLAAALGTSERFGLGLQNLICRKLVVALARTIRNIERIPTYSIEEELRKLKSAWFDLS